jgi:hypothetical protein
MHRPSGCAIAFGISLRVQDAESRNIATRCIAMLYRATRPRELPSSVNALMSGYVLLDAAMRGAVLFLNAGSGARPYSTMHTLSATALVRNCLPVYAAALVPNLLPVCYMKVLEANVRRFEKLHLARAGQTDRQTDGDHSYWLSPDLRAKRHADSCASGSYAKSVLSFVSSSSCNVLVARVAHRV